MPASGLGRPSGGRFGRWAHSRPLNQERLVCCAPSGGATRPSVARPAVSTGHGMSNDSLVALEGGRFLMGTDDGIGHPGDGEGPAREVAVDPFEIDAYAVSNARFDDFVRDTGHVTDAERYGWSFVFAEFLSEDRLLATAAVPAAPWRRQVRGADWAASRRPSFGPRRPFRPSRGSAVVERCALAYAEWAGCRVPSEAGWEVAGRPRAEAVHVGG